MMDVEAQMEPIWFERQRYEEAEARFQVHLAGTAGSSQGSTSSLAEDLERTRQNISQYLARGSTAQGQTTAQLTPEMAARINALEKENKQLKKSVSTLEEQIKRLEERLSALEVSSGGSAPTADPAPAAASDADDDDDFDLFGDDDEDDAEAEKLKAERVAKYNEKKSKKATLIAKSNIILDVKPWDDETDLKEMERLVRTIEMDGLLWGAAKTVPLAYGIKKLQISCVVEDDKVGTDILEEKITEFEDHVQSVDVAAFNKV